MKKVMIAVLVALLFCLLLGSCHPGEGSGSKTDGEKPLYDAFDAGTVDEVPWAAGSGTEEYK